MRCEKCGSKDVTIKQINKKTGAYCVKCGSFIKWVSKADLRTFYNTCFENPNNLVKSPKQFTTKNGITIVKCAKCKCQLYNSNAPDPVGQFNLVNAKFCPNCGAELI